MNTPESKRYIFKGHISLHDVEFFINASSEEEAREKAAACQWDDYDVGASSEGYDIDVDSCEENE